MGDEELLYFDDNELINDDALLNTPKSITSSAPKQARKQAARREHNWTDDEVMKLIGCVEQKRAIWDFGTAGYSKTPIRDAAWREIAPEFGEHINVVQMQTKWQHLRNQYRKEDTKMKMTKSGHATSSRQVKWRFFEAMAFVGVSERELSTISESNISLESVIFFLCFTLLPIELNKIVFFSFYSKIAAEIVDEDGDAIFDISQSTPATSRSTSPLLKPVVLLFVSGRPEIALPNLKLPIKSTAQ